jgi:hypothetical protein
MVGNAVFEGDVAVERGATTAVCTESAKPVPKPFVAVIVRRMVAPTSAKVSRYDWFVALAMDVQFAPLRSQRRHWYANVMGGEPSHAPTPPVSVWPSTTTPEIVGGAVFVGGHSDFAELDLQGGFAVPEPIVPKRNTTMAAKGRSTRRWRDIAGGSATCFVSAAASR